MSTSILKYIIIGIGILFTLIIGVYLVLAKKMGKSEYRQMKKLQEGTKADSFSMEILYQRLYLTYIKTPFIKRYIYKLRRRLEILNIDDEYTTRRDSARILTKAIIIMALISFVTIFITHNNPLLMSILLIFELFIVDTMVDGMVDKIDNNLLKEQINFFAEIRHAYHEYNMVEEAIYQVSLDDEKSVSKQGEKIYEILISDDPETELEKYYDIAPNSYLKEFAGISYLTQEFGDREEDGSSLYLKNINNITQEMQIEILKRDKLNYVFQSLTFISIAPVLLLEPLKNWATSNFSFTSSFYNGKLGMVVQILIVLLTVVSYIMTRKLKDNGGVQVDLSTNQHPWQEKVYNNPALRKIINSFIPKKGSKDYRKMQKLLKDSASKSKMEWVYINRICLAVVTFILSIILFAQLHRLAINYVYTEPTTRATVMGTMSEKNQKKAEELTEQDNFFINKLKGKLDITQSEIEKEMKKSKYYKTGEDDLIKTDAERVLGKLKIVNSENMQWFEELLAIVFSIIAYMAPVWMMMFQKKMRQMEMENEVMQFQTIIVMLMKIERVNVEMILEWLERYANIFKEPVSRCVNNYEAGAWEALEELKNSVTHQDMIRIVESLQAAVEKIPIREAFDELDADRDYHQEKRKATNEMLISRKGLIGKGVGFAPLVCLFIGYLIIPLVVIGVSSMSGAFSQLGA
mgnify:CR=1 FL=1